eukprot:5382467-Pyramimonas_sp.AAC.1
MGANIVRSFVRWRRKRFKNKNQWHNHERSKKHVEAVAALRAQLEEEEGAMRGDTPADQGAEEVRPSKMEFSIKFAVSVSSPAVGSPVSDWSVMRIYPHFLRLIGPCRALLANANPDCTSQRGQQVDYVHTIMYINITSFYGSSSANNGKDALDTP